MDCALEYKSKQDPYWHGFFEWSDYVGIGQWDGTTTQHTTAGEIDFFIRGREW